MAGEEAVPVPLVIRVVDVSVGITPVVKVPVVNVAAVPVVVPLVRFVIVAVVEFSVPIVPLVIISAVAVVVPLVRFVIVAFVTFAVLDVKLAIVPVVLFKERLDVGTASAINAFSLAAVTSLVTPSVKLVPAVKFGIVNYPPLISLDLTKSQAMLIIAPSPPATSSILVLSPSIEFTLLDRSPKFDRDRSTM